MPRGPLPNPERRRANAPTIPTTSLPSDGSHGPPPPIPSWISLGRHGKAWWRWAWATPQASAWSAGDVPFVARRASLEDDLAALRTVEGLTLLDVTGPDADQLREIVRRLASVATGKLGLAREAREMDDRLGLTPKAMAALRWKIVESGDAPALVQPPSGVPSLSDRRRRLIDAS